MSGMTAAAGVFPLEEFRVLATLGKGEFGKVHRATWLTRGCDVALKHIAAVRGEQKIQAEQAGAQLQALAWQRYPDIVPRVYRDGTSADGDYYIAMEFVRGESLHDLLCRRRLSPDEAIRLAAIIAGVLQRLHGFVPPILHSDLKPEHVLVLDDGSVRIIDFGIARRPEAGAATHNAFLSVMYAAPERIEDEARNVHPSDDLWALGVMFFEMLAGRHPRDQYRARIEDAIRGDDLAAAAALLREQPGPLPAGCSPQLEAIVRKLLAPQPGHRYASASLLLRDLDDHANGRDTAAWQQLLAAGRATRVVARREPEAAGAPTLPVPPPLPRSAVPPSVVSPAVVPPVVVPPAPVPRSTVSRPAVAPSTTTAAPAGARRAKPLAPRRRFFARPSAGTLFRAFLTLLVVRLIMGEAHVWNRTDRFRDRIASFESSDLSSIPPMVRSLRDGAWFGFAAEAANRPLADRMLEIVEPTLADFRNDLPSARLPQWRSAAAALAIALEAEPGDRRIRSRARYVDGHLLRIDAQGKPDDASQPILNRAVAAFREAARLDRDWPDPWIALAGVHAYGLRDVEAVVTDVDEAARRGFSGGLRERAAIADAYSYRADEARLGAPDAEGDERRRLLESAATDYQACAENYDGVTGYYNSDRNAARCRRLADVVMGELQAIDSPALELEPFAP